MHTGQVYPALARTLEYWSELQPQKLQALIGTTPNIEEVEVEGEIIRLEVSVTWANEKQDVLLLLRSLKPAGVNAQLGGRVQSANSRL